ncbi:hypothetical protein LSH36_325g04074 [Paralvinella palmiformis]|uniref:Methyltransferase type 11 domain-containing protein n=1 Tax=Paralvinella palmiformis TaxID=53620 RepID=A0AAD9JGK7_9ANNE|nr:hypothetical protein LSH36_325g04074 [Paralvinella palmiformis]
MATNRIIESFRICAEWLSGHQERILIVTAGIGITVMLIRAGRGALRAGLHARAGNVYRNLEVVRRRREMFANIEQMSSCGDHRPLNIVEIGTAVVQNAPHYPTNAEITCVTTATYREVEIERLEDEYPYVNIVYASPETMTSLRDNTFDVVVSTLSLCAVEDVKQTLAEIKRILKKDGRFYFMEHVGAKAEVATSQVQNGYRVWWGTLFYGCKPDEKLLQILNQSGFKKVEIDKLAVDIDTGSDRYIGSLLSDVINRFFTYLIGTHVVGVAIK